MVVVRIRPSRCNPLCHILTELACGGYFVLIFAGVLRGGSPPQRGGSGGREPRRRRRGSGCRQPPGKGVVIRPSRCNPLCLCTGDLTYRHKNNKYP